MPDPWSRERAQEMNQRLELEARLIAGRIGASDVVVIAFYREGEMLHVMDGGTAPTARAQLYANLADMAQQLEIDGERAKKMQ